jgi:hypothetical protein
MFQIEIHKTFIFVLFLFHSSASSPTIQKFPENITSLDGQDVTFTCNAIGSPIPNTTWIFNGKKKLKNCIFNSFHIIIKFFFS